MDPSCVTLPETNIAPENEWLEDEIPFEIAWAMKKKPGCVGYRGDEIYCPIIYRDYFINHYKDPY